MYCESVSVWVKIKSWVNAVRLCIFFHHQHPQYLISVSNQSFTDDSVTTTWCENVPLCACVCLCVCVSLPWVQWQIKKKEHGTAFIASLERPHANGGKNLLSYTECWWLYTAIIIWIFNLPVQNTKQNPQTKNNLFFTQRWKRFSYLREKWVAGDVHR